jgi:prolyl oligopeptidase
MKYPWADVAAVVENFHGTKVADPYRWLEEPLSDRTMAWTQAQNDLTQAYISEIPERSRIRNRLFEFWNYEKLSVPKSVGSRYFYLYNEGLSNQPALYFKDGHQGTPRCLVDPNQMNTNGTVAITNFSASHDGQTLAYTLSENGSDWQEIHVLNVETGEAFAEVIQWCKFTNIAWDATDQGFYYTRFPNPDTVSTEDQSNYNKVYWHVLGTEQRDDRLVYEDPEHKQRGFSPQVSADGRFLVLTVTEGTDPRTRVYVKDLQGEQGFVQLFTEGDALYHYIGNNGGVFYFETDLAAPKGKIIAVDLAHAKDGTWRELVDESDDVLNEALLVHDHFVISYSHQAYHQVFIYTLDGKQKRQLTLPTMGSVVEMSGNPLGTEFFVNFTSYLYPPSIFRYDFNDDSFTEYGIAHLSFDVDDYETYQKFFTSKDGTRVPMFVTHKKGLALDGDHPTLMYGYGGFHLSQPPVFSPSQLLLLEHGGVFAVVSLRGGNEFGEAWHQGGMLENKQNVFDDFHAAGEWLIANGYTRPSRLAIMGRSNGGLLVAATMLQRPELYGAVVCMVPVIDMLRYHKFTVGRYWIPEYGNAEARQDHFAFMYAYSPLHNVRQGRLYPPILMTTGDTDDRVVPMHAKKFTATLQSASPGIHPILLRVDMNAGHGAGKPITKVVEEQSDIYAFLFQELGISM